jgi:ankyrin repeat protein
LRRILAACLLLVAAHSLFAGSREDLFEAVLSNDRIIIEKLIKAGISINIQDPEGFTPLMAAATMGHNDLCRWFLQELNADPDLPDRQGNTPLMAAVRSGNRNGVGILLLHKADPNRINKLGESALSLAINLGRFTIADDLLAAGAFLFKEKIDLPLLDYVYKLRLRIAENTRLLDTAGEGMEIFRMLAANDYLGLRDLLETGHSPNTSDSTGLTPLMYAATLDRPHMLELLFKYGADPLLRDRLGLSALDLAAYYGRVSSVEYLTTRVTWDKKGLPLEKNPLFFALIGRQPEAFALLVSRGFENGKPDSRGVSLIHYLCFFGDLHGYRMLRPTAGLVLLNDSNGKNPLFWALTGFNLTGGSVDYYPLVRILISDGADGRSLVALTTDQKMWEILTGREQEIPK